MTDTIAPRHELQTRVMSSIILGSAVLFITWWHVVSFALLCTIAAFILWKEWRGLTAGRSPWLLPAGMIYIVASCFSLVAIHYWFGGARSVMLLFAVVWAADIAGYAIGKPFGKHKVAPEISPGKTWEGLAGAAIASSVVVMWMFAQEQTQIPIAAQIIIGCTFALVGLLGDLFESRLKRRAGVKDSGNLIPGHGGLFDRVDALMPCAILAALLLAVAARFAH